MNNWMPKCTQCGRFTTNPEVFKAHPVPGMDIEYRLCKRCEKHLTTPSPTERL